MKVIKKVLKSFIFEDVDEVLKCVDVEKWREDYSELLDDYIGESLRIEDSNIQEFLEKNGFYNIDTCWSFAYAQGDGASFTAKWARPERWYLKNILKSYYYDDSEIASIMNALKDIVDKHKVNYFEIINNSFGTYYCHANTKTIGDVEFEKGEYNEVVEQLESVICDLMRWYEDKLEAIAYSEISDEEVVRMIVDLEIKVDEKYLKDECK